METLWKIACEEDKYPGMWQRWFKNQCVAVGWPSPRGYKLNGSIKQQGGWNRARNAIKEMAIGDMVIVALKGNHIGRLGKITGKAIEDDEWNPFVPKGPKVPFGEKGRRISVRWELEMGPDDNDLIVKLPPDHRFSPGEIRPTVSRIHSQTTEQIRQIMRDPRNWVGLLGKFGYEKALSDYIANYPNHLEDGLLPHPNARIRELVFTDKKRLDVLLVDRNEQPVIVECKQHGPIKNDFKQLRQYIDRLKRETGQKASQKVRGILVHSGAQKLTKEIIREANKKPKIEVVSYRLRVDFSPLSTEGG